MAEKEGAPSDQVSLPPTYAPSEAFTDSPPPAYRVQGTAAVKIVKLICMTFFFVTVLICLFILGHRYLMNQKMHQQFEYQQLKQDEKFLNDKNASPLVAQAGIGNFDLNNNVIEEFLQAKEKQKAEEHNNDELEIEQMEQSAIEEAQQVQEEVEHIQNDVLEQVKNEVQAPPLDLMLGAKPMGGNVKCKVQKRQQNMGDGIIRQAVIVKCDDEETEDENAPQIRPMGPPLSLLGNIMKMIASRAAAKSRHPQEPNMPKIEVRPIPIYPPHPSEMMEMNEPFRHFPSPMNGPPRKVVHFIPLNKISGPRPMEPPVEMPPFMEPQPGPFPLKKIINFIPLRKFEEPISEQNEFPPPSFSMHREPETQPRGFLNFIPLRKIMEGPRPEPMMEENEIPAPVFRSQMGPIPFIRPIKIIREQHEPEVDEFPHPPPPPPPFRMMGNHEHIPGPFPFPPQNKPVKIIRLIKRPSEEEEHPEMMDGPFHPPTPMMNIIPRQARRIIQVNREPINGDLPFSSIPLRGGPGPFPLHRGALPMEHHGPHFNRLPVPQAKPRAIPRPMALPGLKLLRIPLNPAQEIERPWSPEPRPEVPEMFPIHQNFPPQNMEPLPETRIATHMEMREPPQQEFPFQREPQMFPIQEEFPMEEEPQFFPAQQFFPSETEYPEDQENFGPPKTHTVIEAAPPPYVEDEQQQQPEILPPPYVQEEFNGEPINFPETFVAHQVDEPSFAEEAKFSPMAEVEPDAEIFEDIPPEVLSAAQEMVPEDVLVETE